MSAPDPEIAAAVLGSDEPLMTSAEVGALLRIDPKTVARHAKAGHLDGIRVGGEWRFTPSQVREALEKWKEGSRADQDG